MMERLPVVSIVMPTFNRLQVLRSTVQSLLRQTIKNWELIVSDDGSGEAVLTYLESLCEDERVRLVRQPHSGNPGILRNAGIAMARAPFVAFLDSDDIWVPSKLEVQLARLRAEPECGWSYTAFTIIDAEGRPLDSERNRAWHPHSGQIFMQTVRTTASIRVSAVLASTQLVRNVGAFDEAMDCSEDYDLWMRLALRSPVCVVEEPVVQIRRHSGNERREAGYAHIARDYSLWKLSRSVSGVERKLLTDERSRNALALATVISAHGRSWRALAVIGKSFPLGWARPHWWYVSAKLLGQALLSLARARSRPT